MSDTPETQEAVERWRQGKINIFDEMARLERERNEWKAKFIQANKEFGCELRDPCGTIWDHAKKLQAEVEMLRKGLSVALEAFAFVTDQLVQAKSALREASEEIVALEKQVSGMKRFSNERYDEIIRVRKERDEARVAFAIATDQLVQVQSKLRETRAALQRLADCDWVITLPDRMDAVRKIARDALEGKA